jgi:hypothetical protein
VKPNILSVVITIIPNMLSVLFFVYRPSDNGFIEDVDEDIGIEETFNVTRQPDDVQAVNLIQSRCQSLRRGLPHPFFGFVLVRRCTRFAAFSIR